MAKCIAALTAWGVLGVAFLIAILIHGLSLPGITGLVGTLLSAGLAIGLGIVIIRGFLGAARRTDEAIHRSIEQTFL